MSLTSKCLLLLVFVAIASTAANKKYQGYGLYRVSKCVLVEKLTSELEGIDWWSRVHRNDEAKGDLMVPRDMIKQFEEILTSNNIGYEVLSDNVQLLIDAERIRQEASSRRGRARGTITFDKYYTHAEMNAYMEEVAANYPDIATVVNLGKTFEGRDMKAIKLSSGSGKRTVFVDAGIHAREWIAPATALYLLQQLTKGGGSQMLDQVDWVIVPQVNPDGYEYTQSEDRLWRKTRSSGNRACEGVDANRNWDFHWMESGASSYPCSDTYAGKQPFSEVEAQHLKNIILDSASNADIYITLHSYGQYILYPWGYSDELPDDWRELDKLGNDMNDAIEAVQGTSYTVGSSGSALYPAAGASDDWSKGVAGIKYSYTIELPGGGWYGFDLPASDILSVVEETLEAFKVVANKFARK